MFLKVFGKSGRGKTELAHTLCVTTQMPGENGFSGGKVIYLGKSFTPDTLMSSELTFLSSDTENTFRPDRLRPIADRFNLDQEAVLDNVLYSRAYTSEQLMKLLDFVCAKFHEEPGIFKLLIVDGVKTLFRGELAEIQQNWAQMHQNLEKMEQNLVQMMSKLQKISEKYNMAVLVTNQTISDPGAFGGNIIADASTTR